jgi:hypothetical protein
MIDHYVILKGTYDDGRLALSIDHHLQQATFGGVAYDRSTGNWLTPNYLTGTDADNDSSFLVEVARSISKYDRDATA